MFGGEAAAAIPSHLPEEQFYDLAEDALKSLGSVHISKNGNITITAKESLKSFLTTVSIDGTIRRKKNNDYEVVLNYSCSPTTANWILAVLLFCVTLFGAAIILVPALEKGKVDKAAERALRDLEDEASDRAIKE